MFLFYDFDLSNLWQNLLNFYFFSQKFDVICSKYEIKLHKYKVKIMIL